MLLGAEQTLITKLHEKLTALLDQCQRAEEEHKAKISIALKSFNMFHPSQISTTYEKSLEVQLLSLKLEQYSAHVNATLKINTFNINDILKRFEQHTEGLTALLSDVLTNQSLLQFARDKATICLKLADAKEKIKACKFSFEAHKMDTPLSACANDSLTLNMSLLALLGNIPDLYSDLFEKKSSEEKFLCECYESIHLAENALEKCQQYQSVLEQLPVLNETPRQMQKSSSSSSDLDWGSSSSDSVEDNTGKQPNNPAILNQYQQGVAANQMDDVNSAMATLAIDNSSEKQRIIPK
ncbi:hypothetical protein [Candidatus Berkiella aquae]|uniref:Uncharacterized protein n=1 Tax=Candidatus Berkiella aquae TaxID=295108 RepID=A0A0Q9YLQ9_9GAMM|nr:hypothetical protein [Candidatus Berkiella aquae]MCS5709894.1 hypothetical protein [Candidatus Berkiella aquae]